MPDRPAPPVPLHCAHRPLTHDGLVVPWANVELADGGTDFRSHHNARWVQAWQRGLCQVDGLPLEGLLVFLCGPNQLRQLRFDEPPVHPQCARYVAQACPMVAGERSHYRAGPSVSHRRRGQACPVAGCDCGGWVATPGTRSGPGGGPAHPWYAVTARGYSQAAVPESDGLRLTGGSCQPEQVVRVQLVSEPGNPRAPWELVTDWEAGYEPPELYVEPEKAPWAR